MPNSLFSLGNHYRQAAVSRSRQAISDFVLPIVQKLDREDRLVPRALKDVSEHFLTAEQANVEISRAIEAGRKYSVSRFGRSELLASLQQVREKEWHVGKRLLSSVITGDPFRTKPKDYNHLWISGFYPYWEGEAVFQFSKVIRSASEEVDLLGSWVRGENLIPEISRSTMTTDLPSLEPFHLENPWTSALQGKRVLVVHPFAISIEKQFERLAKVHAAPMNMPDFALETLRPPVTRVSPLEIPHQPELDWFQQLYGIQDEIQQRQFDVAIVGAGSYGMPIASYVRRMGKVAINMGGASQLLFGIWGNRWNGIPRFESLRNEYWVRPQGAEVPANVNEIEAGAYW